jgi:hypothetical protein
LEASWELAERNVIAKCNLANWKGEDRTGYDAEEIEVRGGRTSVYYYVIYLRAEVADAIRGSLTKPIRLMETLHRQRQSDKKGAWSNSKAVYSMIVEL